MSLPDFLIMMTEHKESAVKDGPCFVPGTFINARRVRNEIREISVLVYDIDGYMTWEGAVEHMRDLGYLCALSTTYSHLTTTTRINGKKYDKWMSDNDETEMAAYLAHIKKEYLENVVIVNERDDDNNIIVSHDPVHKMRIAIPLDVPFYFPQVHDDPKVAAEIWAETYNFIGDKLNLPYDKACSDASRLFFLPTHAPGHEFHALFIDGQTLDYRNFEIDDQHILSTAIDTVARNKRNHRNESAYVIPRTDGTPFNLNHWYKDYLGRLDIFALLEAECPQFIINKKDEKWDITCPFEEYHTTAGGNGTIISNPSDTYGFGVYCLHESCQQRPPLEFLNKMILDGWFSVDDVIRYTLKMEDKHEHIKKIRAERESKRTALPDELKKMSVADRVKTMYDKDTDIESYVPKDAALSEVIFDSSIMVDVDEDDDRLILDEGNKSILERHASVVGGMIQSVRINHQEYVDSCPTEKPDEDGDDKHVGESKLVLNLLAHEENVRNYTETYELSNYLKNYEVTKQEEVRLFSISQIPACDIQVYHKERGKLININAISLKRSVRNMREGIHPYKTLIAELVQKQLSNYQLTSEMRKLIDFYGMTPTEFNKLYMEVYKEVHGTTLSPEFETSLKKFNERHAKVRIGSRVEILDKYASIKQGKRVSQTVAACNVEYSNSRFRYIAPSGEEVEENIFSYWLDNWPNHEIYNDVVFDPAQKFPDSFNLWRGFTFEGDPDGDWGMMEDHLLNTWCGGSRELFNWLHTYFANIIQKPGDRPPSAVAIVGGFGAGKSLPFAHGIGKMIAPYYRSISQPDQIVGRWNGSVLGTSLLCLSEEAVFKGSVKTMDILKELISGDQISMEEKFGDTSMRPIHTRFCFASNHKHALGLSEKERRFFVLETDDNNMRSNEFFEELSARLKGEKGFPNLNKAWFHALQTFDPGSVGMSWQDLYSPPMTQAKLYQIASSRDGTEMFFYDLLLNGEFTMLDVEDMSYEVTWKLDEECVIPVKEMPRIYRQFMNAFDKTHLRYNPKGYIVALEQGLGVEYTKLQQFSRTKRKTERVIVLPSRREALDRAHTEFNITNQEYELAIIDHDMITDDELAEDGIEREIATFAEKIQRGA
ncbi:MAG: hypothetical protein DSY80_04985 [Desulfocapsa sp.]|nr:MAG: hypothetical protein DSY80_04985 [Desulfocapsa sp.]